MVALHCVTRVRRECVAVGIIASRMARYRSPYPVKIAQTHTARALAQIVH